MKFSLFVLLVAVAVVYVQAAPSEQGSWCYNPTREAFWGAASSACCQGRGSMGNNRRCYGLNGDAGKCQAFYECCINQFGSGNKPNNPCN